MTIRGSARQQCSRIVNIVQPKQSSQRRQSVEQLRSITVIAGAPCTNGSSSVAVSRNTITTTNPTLRQQQQRVLSLQSSIFDQKQTAAKRTKKTSNSTNNETV